MKIGTILLFALITLAVIVSACSSKQIEKESETIDETTLTENDMTANLVIEEQADPGALDEIEVSDSLVE